MTSGAAWLGRAAGLSVALATGARGQAPGTPAIFPSHVEAVYVDAFVTRSGQPLPGLVASDFELRDNQVVQSLDLLAAESLPILAVLVFDTSSSMEGDRLEALRAAGREFLTGLRPGDEAALVGFSERIVWLASPTTDKDGGRRALERLRAEGATSVYDALYAAVTLSDPGRRPLIVLFTDGEDNGSWLDEGELKAAVARSNALVYVVGWRPRPDFRTPTIVLPDPLSERVLREIAESSGGRFLVADSKERLQRSFTAVADAMRQRYVLRYEARGVKREGWHRIDVRLKAKKGDVQVRRGYWVAAR